MCRSFKEVYKLYKEKESLNITMRDAAYMLAIGRLADAMRVRGWLGSAR